MLYASGNYIMAGIRHYGYNAVAFGHDTARCFYSYIGAESALHAQHVYLTLESNEILRYAC